MPAPVSLAQTVATMERLVRCTSCGAMGTVDAQVPFDPVADRAAWPHVECFLCDGALVPETLN